MLRITTTILFSVVTLATAQSAGDFASKKADLEALERMWNQAQVQKDARAIGAMISDRFINTEFDGQVSDRAKFLADFRDPTFRPDFMNIGNVQVNVYGNMAVVFGDYHTKGMHNGKPYEHFGRFTDTWIFLNGRWLCVASHSSLKK